MGGLRDRAAAGLIVLLLIGCTTSAPSQTATTTPQSTTRSASLDPAATSSPGPAATDAAPADYPADDPRSFGEDLLAGPADPITLDVTLADEGAVTRDIGPAGGIVEATGPDGTEFTLTIAADSLAVSVPITMIPIAASSGLPDGVTPDHVLGVQLEPDGLELGAPATLEIRSSSEVPIPDVGTWAMSYQGSGTELGFQAFDQDADGVVIEINHFSGYQVVFPIFIANEPPSFIKKYMTQTEVEKRLQSEVAGWLTYLRQLDLRGISTEGKTLALARQALTLYKRLVISPRVAEAGNSCGHAHAAMKAYLDYQRNRQLLGVGDDPEFDLVGAGTFVPAALVDLAVEVCFEEAYARCTRTGEFPILAQYYLTFFRQNELILGLEPKAEHIALAGDYLKRCGRWRVVVNTVVVEDQPEQSWFDHHEAHREIIAQWKPGGVYGIQGSTIEGTGPVETTLLDRSASCESTVSNIQNPLPATVRIPYMSFDHYEGPTLTGDPIPPVPVGLTVMANLGHVSYHYQCLPGGAEHDRTQTFEFQYRLAEQEKRPTIPPTTLTFEDVEAGTAEATFNIGWQFSSGPYRATLVQTETFIHPVTGHSTDVQNEVLVEHQPN